LLASVADGSCAFDECGVDRSDGDHLAGSATAEDVAHNGVPVHEDGFFTCAEECCPVGGEFVCAGEEPFELGGAGGFGDDVEGWLLVGAEFLVAAEAVDGEVVAAVAAWSGSVRDLVVCECTGVGERSVALSTGVHCPPWG